MGLIGDSGRQTFFASVAGSGNGATDQIFGFEPKPQATVVLKTVIIGRRTSTSEACCYSSYTLIRRLGTANPVVMGSATDTLEEDATANFAISASGTNIQITVTAPAGKTYNWTLEAEIFDGPLGPNA